MRKFIRLLIGLMACCVLAYSVYQMYAFGSQASASDKLNESLIQEVVSVRKNTPQQPQTEPDGGVEETEQTVPMEAAPISVDFELLRRQSSNIVGWLYCEDTPINLPVAQSGDNDYYLRRLLDGTGNNSGTLFVDYRNARDFSDRNTVIYGHNMKNKTMFGSIGDYRKQEYYDAHPELWLLTEDGNFKVELIAGYVTPSTSNAYVNPDSDEEMLELTRLAAARSTFSSGITPELGDRYLTMSTCSYEYDNARYVLVGRLVPAL